MRNVLLQRWPLLVLVVVIVYTVNALWIGPRFSKLSQCISEKVREDQETLHRTNVIIQTTTPVSVAAKPKTTLNSKENTGTITVSEKGKEGQERLRKTNEIIQQTPTTSVTAKPKTTLNQKVKLKEPRTVHTVPPPAESAALCESEFPPKVAKQPIGCRSPSSAPPGIIFNCYDPIMLSCNDSLDDARDKYYRHVMRDHIKCKDTRRFGKPGDGGWTLCMAGPFKPKQNNCLIYSIGIRDDWSFDDAISSEFGCTDMAFDPSIHRKDHQHSERVWFYDTGLGGKNEKNSLGWKMRTLYSMMKQLNHVDRTIDMVKFDIEFSEWTAIAAMLRENALVNVKQIAFEIHSWRDTKKDYIFFWKQLQGLEDSGFQRWHHHALNWRCFFPDGIKRYCPQVNMNFINTNFIKATS